GSREEEKTEKWGNSSSLVNGEQVESNAISPQPLASGLLSKIQVVLGLPDRCHRQRPDWVKVATNRRMVRSPELEQTILSAMARTCPRDRYPICFLHLQICPSLIDWNRHPAKAEMYLHSLSYWQEQVSCVIEQALRISPTNLPEATYSQRVEKLLKVSEEKGAYNVSRSVQSAPEEDKNTQKFRQIGLIELRAIAQVHNMYILAEHPTGMWLVEQHIAHERVLYEQLCDRWQLVSLEPPVILNHLTPAQVEQLQRLGLDVEPFGEQLWAVRNAPELLTKRDDCADALLELSLGGDLQTAQVATACRSAIRNGTPLSLPDMQTLLDQWKSTRNPRTCPHGRPIYLSLEESALARFFRRHWVIGKSHGI
ncbi:MAG TPA: DNA mismatch repair endonuclease MutL, partial [Cyanobacteria bacterium UBA8543]|nr:DNA mismatch repair endonuclease MutL [Cyanobacteria bacterium UBA8543]